VSAVKTLARLPQRTMRVQHFVDMVNKANAVAKAKKVEPVTDYAKASWPHNPDEFFAEAYSYWLTDPKFLEENSEPVFQWFKAGHHRD
jgi:hypothetical protein